MRRWARACRCTGCSSAAAARPPCCTWSAHLHKALCWGCWPAGLRAFASACCGRARSFLRPGASPPRGRPCSRCFPRAVMWARPWGRSAWAARRTGRRRPARCLRGPRGSLGRCARACCWRRCSRCCAAACTRRFIAAKRGPACPQGANGGAGNRRKLSFQTGTAVCRRGERPQNEQTARPSWPRRLCAGRTAAKRRKGCGCRFGQLEFIKLYHWRFLYMQSSFLSYLY